MTTHPHGTHSLNEVLTNLNKKHRPESTWPCLMPNVSGIYVVGVTPTALFINNAGGSLATKTKDRV